ncbi:PP2C family protein-serine/threonine phosphatase [Primorskyibacter sp. 2E233]|uniref:PP2C family protein-serine/threonine phosphatase n=1 Tax=Primorskyibacter sp. 2E233 TaxID=3413431 RepID=UPI003BF400C6
MTELATDATAKMDIGQRTRQEDAVIADFSQGARLGLAVLSDGMGGHEDGDLASRVIAGEMFGELFFSAARPDALLHDAPTTFQHALSVANRKLRNQAKAGVLSDTSGGTLVSVAVVGGQLHWISVGDSPLYLYRDKTLRRLNEDHSMAPQIDMMVREGLIDDEEGRNHPQRNCLTSAVTGADIHKVDCPLTPTPLMAGDIIILASDGINTLPDEGILALTRRYRHKDSQQIARELMNAVHSVGSPDQDNTSVVVIKMQDQAHKHRSALSNFARDISTATDERYTRVMTSLGQAFRPKTRHVGS